MAVSFALDQVEVRKGCQFINSTFVAQQRMDHPLDAAVREIAFPSWCLYSGVPSGRPQRFAADGSFHRRSKSDIPALPVSMFI